MGFPAHRPDHQELVPQFCLQRGKQQPELPSQDRRTSGPCNVYSPFHLVIDWVGIRRTFFDTLEDLDFTDDLALLFHMHQLIQEKTCRLSKFGQKVALQISKRKTEVMTLNVNTQHQSCLMTRPLPEQRPLPIWAALSDRMEVPTRTFRADRAKSQGRLEGSECSLEIITVQHQY